MTGFTPASSGSVALFQPFSGLTATPPEGPGYSIVTITIPPGATTATAALNPSQIGMSCVQSALVNNTENSVPIKLTIGNQIAWRIASAGVEIVPVYVQKGVIYINASLDAAIATPATIQLVLFNISQPPASAISALDINGAVSIGSVSGIVDIAGPVQIATSGIGLPQSASLPSIIIEGAVTLALANTWYQIANVTRGQSNIILYANAALNIGITSSASPPSVITAQVPTAGVSPPYLLSEGQYLWAQSATAGAIVQYTTFATEFYDLTPNTNTFSAQAGYYRQAHCLSGNGTIAGALPSTQLWTIEFFMYVPAQLGAGNYTLLDITVGNSSFTFYATNGTIGNFKLNCVCVAASVNKINATAIGSFTNAAWHYVVLNVSSAGTLTIYIDGVAPTAFQGLYAPTLGSSQLLGVGIQGNLTNPNAGYIAELAVWNFPKYSAAPTPPFMAWTGVESGLTLLYHFNNDMLDYGPGVT